MSSNNTCIICCWLIAFVILVVGGATLNDTSNYLSREVKIVFIVVGVLGVLCTCAYSCLQTKRNVKARTHGEFYVTDA